MARVLIEAWLGALRSNKIKYFVLALARDVRIRENYGETLPDWIDISPL